MKQSDQEKSAVLAEWHRRHAAGVSAASINKHLQVLVPGTDDQWIVMQDTEFEPTLSVTAMRWKPVEVDCE